MTPRSSPVRAWESRWTQGWSAPAPRPGSAVAAIIGVQDMALYTHGEVALTEPANAVDQRAARQVTGDGCLGQHIEFLFPPGGAQSDSHGQEENEILRRGERLWESSHVFQHPVATGGRWPSIVQRISNARGVKENIFAGQGIPLRDSGGPGTHPPAISLSG